MSFSFLKFLYNNSPMPALYAAAWRNPHSSQYPSTPDYPDTTVQSSLYPPQTAGSVPIQVHAAAS